MSAEPITYPDALEIKPLAKPPNATIRVPGSKSITNRALVLAAMASRHSDCELRGALQSEDTKIMARCLQMLGFPITLRWEEAIIRVGRSEWHFGLPARGADLFAGNSGTTMRFLTALTSLGYGRFRLDGATRMRERPIQDLLDALQQLGVQASSERRNGYPPVIVEARTLKGGRVSIKGDVSSQFLSALLMVAPLAHADVTIDVDGALVSWPYVDMTIQMMREFGAEITSGMSPFQVPAPQTYRLKCYDIEPDASAASYFLAAAAILGGRVSVLGIPEDTLQGDVRFINVLDKMGCRVEHCSSGITVHGRNLLGVSFDMNYISDTVMTLAAVACFAEGPTTIRNVAHIRHKETDRIAALATELRKVGAEVEEYPDGLKITPQPLHGAVIETYNDHRMAMSMALIGLRVPGIVIKNPGCVAKTYPRFWEDLEKLRV